MISRSRSAPTAAAISIECATSANSTVTCLYSADVAAGVIGAPHLLQNRESGGSSVPHDLHPNPVAVMSSPSIVPRCRYEHRSRQYRVTTGQPACAISPLRSGQWAARHDVPRGGLGRISATWEVARAKPLESAAKPPGLTGSRVLNRGLRNAREVRSTAVGRRRALRAGIRAFRIPAGGRFGRRFGPVGPGTGIVAQIGGSLADPAQSRRTPRRGDCWPQATLPVSLCLSNSTRWRGGQ